MSQRIDGYGYERVPISEIVEALANNLITGEEARTIAYWNFPVLASKREAEDRYSVPPVKES